MRAEILWKAHASYRGVEASLCKDDVERNVSSCTICQEFSAGQPHMKMQMHEVPDLPWKRVAADVLQIIFSDYWEIDALPSTDSAAIIKVMKVQFVRHGIPTILITDNVTYFTSTEFQAFSRTWKSRSICENSKEHNEEMAQHPHVRFEGISSATYVKEGKNPNAYINRGF
ncbi:hypothetical protein PR048_019847 [Dryococelus australis]|uniref:Integrase catalytic domain-containing protein n=1 Tax=Dryococelus australis TaxID=614101 RepID=A0ABQ9H4M8_9NEOP|nr:hypothetical protein PR048_019847 [Dryococelus australis]